MINSISPSCHLLPAEIGHGNMLHWSAFTRLHNRIHILFESLFISMKYSPTNNSQLNNRRSNAEIREENEANILKAAEEIFATHGYRGASMQLVADIAKLPKSNVLYYFQSKKNLYKSVLENMLSDWMEAAATFEQHQDPKVVLSKYIAAKMKLARMRPHGSKVWAREIMSGAPVMEQFLSGTLKVWTQQRVKYIERWIAEGKIKSVEPNTLLYMIWASTQHYADFAAQITILHDNQALTDQTFEQSTTALTEIVLNSVGLEA